MIEPERVAPERVEFVQCMEGYACLDVDNFKQLLKNLINTEAYIEQIENVLKELSEPVKPSESK